MDDKIVKLLRIQTLILAAVLLIVLVVGAFLLLQVQQLSAQVQSMDLEGIAQWAQTLKQIDVTQLNETIASFRTAADNLGSVDIEALNRGIDAFGSVDVEALNSGIEALGTVGEKLNGIDVDKFNSMITTMNTAAEGLSKVSGVMGKLFGK